ncbi:MAG TPA: glycine cleavage system protein GcvH [Bacteroidales bacterium]|jgi:glycine cleavage system H protein|nr:glycine cleavage system protein GcvH [Bacteroidales bacterium]HOL98145.1 glycine cleavage system protein GcvH [Bacteroidales bacterium]HOM36502.1 glycine cleavage system protein GcvH [Bacteroidales bacterium]HPD23958.1 glycine cleavage system protein GcvH [Bacteroidales bacterium]HRS99938.1 glycine cleavage system protein GcvH [Bacteroidales bacterium]
MNFPKELKYTETHEWIKVDGENAFVGITEFAATHLGDIVFIEIETEGENLEAKEAFGSIEAVKTVSDVYMPVSGEVIEVNQAILDDPALVNKDCYGDGWLIKIKINNPEELNNLLDAQAYEAIAKE